MTDAQQRRTRVADNSFGSVVQRGSHSLRDRGTTIGFPDEWKKIAENELNCDSIALVRRTPENISFKPVYTASDLPSVPAQ